MQSTKPSNGKEDAYRNNAVRIIFNKPLARDTFINYSNIMIEGTASTTVEDPVYTSYEQYFATPTLSDSGLSLTIYSGVIEGKQILPPNCGVRITLSGNIRDEEGIPLGSAYTFTFEAGTKADLEPPTITDIIISSKPLVSKDDSFTSDANPTAAPALERLTPIVTNRTSNKIYIGIEASAGSSDDIKNLP